MHNLREWIADTFAGAVRVRPLLNIWQWAAETIVFDSKMGNITGPYRPDLTPFNKLFQEAITNQWSEIPEEDWWLQSLVSRGQRCDEAFYLKSSQSGVTACVVNACVYLPLFDPGRLLYVNDSREKAKRVAKFRVIPFLREHCGNVIDDDADVSTSIVELANMIEEFGGSYASGLFSEKPLRFGFLDDVEYMVSQGGVSGILDGVHVIDHMRSRFTTSENSFLGVFTKPNLESSEVVSNHRGGSQHRYLVRCPRCGERIPLVKSGLNYGNKLCRDLFGRYDLEAVQALTTYTCQICSGDIEETEKYEMNLGGVWIPKSLEDRRKDDDAPLSPGRLSLTINDLYSPFKKVGWGKLATLIIEAEGNPAKEKHVATNHFAIPWRENAIRLRADHVRAIIAGTRDITTGKHYPDDLDGEGRLKVPAYKRGEIPFIPAFLSITSDVQGDCFKYIIAAFKHDGTCAVVDYGKTLSSEDLFDLTNDPRATDGTRLFCPLLPDASHIIEHGLIDSGHDTFAIYDFCIRTGFHWYPSKGVGSIDGGRLIEGRDDVYDGDYILRYHYNDHQIKIHLYKNKIARAHDPKNKGPRLYLPSDVEDEFIVELLSESLQPRPGIARRMEWFHDTKIGPNDWGDALKMQYVIWQIAGPQLQAEDMEDRRERRLADASSVTEATSPTDPDLARAIDILERAHLAV